MSLLVFWEIKHYGGYFVFYGELLYVQTQCLEVSLVRC